MAELNQVISDSARARIATKFNMTQETDNSYINTDALPSTAAQPTAEPELAPKPEPVPEPETEQFVSSSPATSTLDDADADPFPEPEFFDELLRDDPPKVDPVTIYPDPDRTG
jgi:hypothetical protein